MSPSNSISPNNDPFYWMERFESLGCEVGDLVQNGLNQKEKDEFYKVAWENLPKLGGMIAATAGGLLIKKNPYGLIGSFVMPMVWGTLTGTGTQVALTGLLHGFDQKSFGDILVSSANDAFGASMSISIARGVTMALGALGVTSHIARGIAVNEAIGVAHAIKNWDATYGIEDVIISGMTGALGGAWAPLLQNRVAVELFCEINREFGENILQKKFDRFSDGDLTIQNVTRSFVLSFAELGGSIKGHRGELDPRRGGVTPPVQQAPGNRSLLAQVGTFGIVGLLGALALYHSPAGAATPEGVAAGAVGLVTALLGGGLAGALAVATDGGRLKTASQNFCKVLTTDTRLHHEKDATREVSFRERARLYYQRPVFETCLAQLDFVSFFDEQGIEGDITLSALLRPDAVRSITFQRGLGPNKPISTVTFRISKQGGETSVAIVGAGEANRSTILAALAKNASIDWEATSIHDYQGANRITFEDIAEVGTESAVLTAMQLKRSGKATGWETVNGEPCYTQEYLFGTLLPLREWVKQIKALPLWKGLKALPEGKQYFDWKFIANVKTGGEARYLGVQKINTPTSHDNLEATFRVMVDDPLSPQLFTTGIGSGRSAKNNRWFLRVGVAQNNELDWDLTRNYDERVWDEMQRSLLERTLIVDHFGLAKETAGQEGGGFENGPLTREKIKEIPQIVKKCLKAYAIFQSLPIGTPCDMILRGFKVGEIWRALGIRPPNDGGWPDEEGYTQIWQRIERVGENEFCVTHPSAYGKNHVGFFKTLHEDNPLTPAQVRKPAYQGMPGLLQLAHDYFFGDIRGAYRYVSGMIHHIESLGWAPNLHFFQTAVPALTFMGNTETRDTYLAIANLKAESHTSSDGDTETIVVTWDNTDLRLNATRELCVENLRFLTPYEYSVMTPNLTEQWIMLSRKKGSTAWEITTTEGEQAVVIADLGLAHGWFTRQDLFRDQSVDPIDPGNGTTAEARVQELFRQEIFSQVSATRRLVNGKWVFTRKSVEEVLEGFDFRDFFERHQIRGKFTLGIVVAGEHIRTFTIRKGAVGCLPTEYAQIELTNFDETSSHPLIVTGIHGKNHEAVVAKIAKNASLWPEVDFIETWKPFYNRYRELWESIFRAGAAEAIFTSWGCIRNLDAWSWINRKHFMEELLPSPAWTQNLTSLPVVKFLTPFGLLRVRVSFSHTGDEAKYFSVHEDSPEVDSNNNGFGIGCVRGVKEIAVALTSFYQARHRQDDIRHMAFPLVKNPGIDYGLTFRFFPEVWNQIGCYLFEDTLAQKVGLVRNRGKWEGARSRKDFSNLVAGMDVVNDLLTHPFFHTQPLGSFWDLTLALLYRERIEGLSVSPFGQSEGHYEYAQVNARVRRDAGGASHFDFISTEGKNRVPLTLTFWPEFKRYQELLKQDGFKGADGGFLFARQEGLTLRQAYALGLALIPKFKFMRWREVGLSHQIRPLEDVIAVLGTGCIEFADYHQLNPVEVVGFDHPLQVVVLSPEDLSYDFKTDQIWARDLRVTPWEEWNQLPSDGHLPYAIMRRQVTKGKTGPWQFISGAGKGYNRIMSGFVEGHLAEAASDPVFTNSHGFYEVRDQLEQVTENGWVRVGQLSQDQGIGLRVVGKQDSLDDYVEVRKGQKASANGVAWYHAVARGARGAKGGRLLGHLLLNKVVRPPLNFKEATVGLLIGDLQDPFVSGKLKEGLERASGPVDSGRDVVILTTAKDGLENVRVVNLLDEIYDTYRIGDSGLTLTTMQGYVDWIEGKREFTINRLEEFLVWASTRGESLIGTRPMVVLYRKPPTEKNYKLDPIGTWLMVRYRNRDRDLVEALDKTGVVKKPTPSKEKKKEK